MTILKGYIRTCISSEIAQVARMLTKTAERLLPCVKPRRVPQFRDEDLSHLCVQSRAAHAAWGGGMLEVHQKGHFMRRRTELCMRKRVRWCAA